MILCILDTDELNMLYVAITRAKRQVYLNKSVLQVLAEGKEHLMFPSLRVRISHSKELILCVWQLLKILIRTLRIKAHLKSACKGKGSPLCLKVFNYSIHLKLSKGIHLLFQMHNAFI